MSTFFLVRHGERADESTQDDYDSIELLYDPHLTRIGKQQATNTGFFIQKTVQKHASSKHIPVSKPKYLILTSPFLRCVQTACQIAKTLKPKSLYGDSIFLEDSICEILYHEKNVMPHLYIKSKSQSEIDKYADSKLLKPSWIKGNIKPKYPEDRDTCKKRMQYAYEYIKNYILGCKELEGVVIILVSHGLPVRIVLDALAPCNYQRKIEFCSTSQIYHSDSKTSKVLIENSNKHTSDKICEKNEQSVKITAFQEEKVDSAENLSTKEKKGSSHVLVEISSKPNSDKICEKNEESVQITAIEEVKIASDEKLSSEAKKGSMKNWYKKFWSKICSKSCFGPKKSVKKYTSKY